MAKWPYNTSEWRQIRGIVLAGNPPCRITPGCRRRATVVDHFPIPVQLIRDGLVDPSYAFDLGNLRPGCKPCNDREGGRLAGRRRRGEAGMVQSPRSRRW